MIMRWTTLPLISPSSINPLEITTPMLPGPLKNDIPIPTPMLDPPAIDPPHHSPIHRPGPLQRRIPRAHDRLPDVVKAMVDVIVRDMLLAKRKAEILPVGLSTIPVLQPGHLGLDRREAVQLVEDGQRVLLGGGVGRVVA